MMTPAKVQQLLESSDLPRRLETARSQPEYRDAMHVEPKRPPMIAMIAILALLGGAAALPLVGIAVMPTRPPFGVYVFLAVLSAMFVALTVATARRFVTLRHAPVRRELYAVIDRDHLMIDTTNIY